MKSRKSCFTLIELLVVLFIISFGVILTGVKVKGIYDEQRFLSEAQQVLSHLAMAQDLMLIMDADVKVNIAPDSDKEELQVWIEVEKPLEEPWARFVERKMTLKAIRSFEFDNTHGRQLTLLFSLGQMSKGVLTLYEGEKNDSHKADSRISFIELAGYPRPLKATTEKEEHSMMARRTTDKSRALYPAEVYEELYEDPNEEKEAS